jgi:hypothetical protein
VTDAPCLSFSCGAPAGGLEGLGRLKPCPCTSDSCLPADTAAAAAPCQLQPSPPPHLRVCVRASQGLQVVHSFSTLPLHCPLTCAPDACCGTVPATAAAALARRLCAQRLAGPTLSDLLPCAFRLGSATLRSAAASGTSLLMAGPARWQLGLNSNTGLSWLTSGLQQPPVRTPLRSANRRRCCVWDFATMRTCIAVGS